MDLKKLKEFFNKQDNKQDNKEKNNDFLGKKNVANLLIIFLTGVLVLITVSFFKTSDISTVSSKNVNNNENKTQKEVEPQNKNSEDYEKTTEDKLKETLEKIQGVGKVEVMINFESGEEQVPAVNVNDTTNTTQEKDNEGGVRSSTQKNNGSTVVITNNGNKSEPLIVKKYSPKVLGVCIVAEGAENKVTELRITQAVIDLFGISEDKVNVYPMKK